MLHMRYLKRPQMKQANVKVSDADIAYFSLGIGMPDRVLPSEMSDYKSDERAVRLVADVHAGKDLSGQDFSGINLKNADISGGRFQGCSFRGAIFYQTKAQGADFTGSDFEGAYFEKTDLSKAHLKGAKFCHTYLRDLDLKDAEVDDETLRRIDAMAWLIRKVENGEIDISMLTAPELQCLDLRRLDLSRLDWQSMDFSMFDMEGVCLPGVHIDPKQLLGLETLKDFIDFANWKEEQELKQEQLKILKNKQQELMVYATKEAEEGEQHSPSHSPKKRPKKKGLQTEIDTDSLTVSSSVFEKKTDKSHQDKKQPQKLTGEDTEDDTHSRKKKSKVSIQEAAHAPKQLKKRTYQLQKTRHKNRG